MSFSPRLTQPESSNPNYIHVSAGGKNKCMLRSGGSVLPNCTGYAWGRFMEILGSTPTLSCQNAEDWWAYRQDGYERGQTPRLGAVICWRKGQAGNGSDGAGHVGIVEQLNPDGSIVTSESSYSTYYWRTKYRGGPAGNWGGGDYVFQGFIYNPAVSSSTVVGSEISEESDGAATALKVEVEDTISKFVDAAKSQIGKDGSWTWANSGQPYGNHWSCSFVAACAKEAKILNTCIPKTFSCSSLAQLGVTKKMGEWHRGPLQGGLFTPEIGDIMMIRDKSLSPYPTEYGADRVGIVSEVSSGSVSVISGDSSSVDPRSSRVSLFNYSLTSPLISGYYRPFWSLIGYDHWTYSSLYESKSTEKDAIAREMGYFNSQFEPSIFLSNIRLSVINYTSPVSALFDNLHLESVEGIGFSVEMSVEVNLDQLGSSQRIATEFLMDKGLNCAAAIGIVANIDHESGFRTGAVGDGGTSFGICQWHLSRGEAMKRVAGPNWANNLTGQLSYLWQELSYSSFRDLLSGLQNVSNSLEGAKTAADLFVRIFEVPANVDVRSLERQNTAEKLWNKITRQLT